METSLHRDLKRLYAGEAAQCEVRLAGYRIDAVVDRELIEVQHGPLAAIRDKVRKLLAEHRVRVVKPIIARKQLVYRRRKGGRIARRRLSPKQGKLLDLFDNRSFGWRRSPTSRPSFLVRCRSHSTRPIWLPD
jgi:hypothetical protein